VCDRAVADYQHSIQPVVEVLVLLLFTSLLSLLSLLSLSSLSSLTSAHITKGALKDAPPQATYLWPVPSLSHSTVQYVRLFMELHWPTSQIEPSMSSPMSSRRFRAIVDPIGPWRRLGRQVICFSRQFDNPSSHQAPPWRPSLLPRYFGCDCKPQGCEMGTSPSSSYSCYACSRLVPSSQLGTEVQRYVWAWSCSVPGTPDLHALSQPGYQASSGPHVAGSSHTGGVARGICKVSMSSQSVEGFPKTAMLDAAGI
jgi:hypothetical protein